MYRDDNRDVGDSDFSLSHARVMLINSPFRGIMLKGNALETSRIQNYTLIVPFPVDE